MRRGRRGGGGGGGEDGGSISCEMASRAKAAVDGLMQVLGMTKDCAWLSSRGGGGGYAEGPWEHS